MPRAYPKGAFAIGSNPQQNNPAPYAPVPPGPAANQGQQPAQGNTPQFYNPQTFGVAPPAQNNPPPQNYNFVPSPANAAPATYATPTTVATAPDLEPLPQTNIAPISRAPEQRTVAPPPTAGAVNTGPRHAPPPSDPIGQGNSPITQVPQLRGKRLLQTGANTYQPNRSAVSRIFFFFLFSGHSLISFVPRNFCSQLLIKEAQHIKMHQQIKEQCSQP